MAKQPILIILAGGASSRMWPFREKSLLRFGSEPLLISQLQRYHKLGFKRTVIVTNPNNQAQIDALATPMRDQMQIDLVVQQDPHGMGDAILKAEPALEDAPESAVYINQVHDVVEDRLHRDMLDAHKKQPKVSFLAAYEVNYYFPGGYLIIDDQHRITDIVEKPGADNQPSNLVNIVAHVHSNAAQLFEAIRAEYARSSEGDDHYERAMAALMPENTYRPIPYKGYWAALKFPWHTLDVMNYYLSQIDGQIIAEDAFIAPGAHLVGNVYIGAGAKVFPGAAVVGPAYIGAGTVVGNNALVRNSMVLNHCNVGFTTEVARSYVADHCGMHACRVLDSVFGERVNFSAGCTTANLRIDQGDVRSVIKGHKLSTGRSKLGAMIGNDAFLAVDTMTMPGVKIGEKAQVGPGTHVRSDILDGQRVYVKQVLEVVEINERDQS